jgi:hypothetical protein
MIDPEYLPPDFKFRDPSKMKKFHYQLLLEYWYERQGDPDIDTVFAFSGFWDHGSNSVVAAYKKQSDRRRLPKRSKRAHGKTRRGVKSRSSSKRNGEKAGAKRSGPPGVRAGDPGWILSSEEEEYEDSDEEDGEEEDNHQLKRKVPPKSLPFSAPQRHIPSRIMPKKRKHSKVANRLRVQRDRDVVRGSGAGENHEEAEVGKQDDGNEDEENNRRMQLRLPVRPPSFPSQPRETTETVSSGMKRANKLKTRGAVSKMDAPKILTVGRRPIPKPAFRGAPKNAFAGPSQAPPPVPPPLIPEKKGRRPHYLSEPPDLGPNFDRPATRNGGKRKAVDAELPVNGGSSTKKVKKGAKNGKS